MMNRNAKRAHVQTVKDLSERLQHAMKKIDWPKEHRVWVGVITELSDKILEDK